MVESDRATASWQIDCRNLPAPYPLLGARAALAMMEAGEVLGLFVTDRDTIIDVPAWCRMTGHRLIVAEERRGIHCVLIRKGNAPCRNH
jgi:tRNA 2-thiouridine synthesizing protein A